VWIGRWCQSWFTCDRCNSCLTWNSYGTVFKQASRCTYNVTLRRLRTVAVGKRKVLRILSVCLQLYLSSVQSACAVLYCHLWPVRLYHILPHYLINRSIFGRRLLNINVCVLLFSATFVWNISHNSAGYCHKWTSIVM
jgi:hypothetical protein